VSEKKKKSYLAGPSGAVKTGPTYLLEILQYVSLAEPTRTVVVNRPPIWLGAGTQYSAIHSTSWRLQHVRPFFSDGVGDTHSPVSGVKKLLV